MTTITPSERRALRARAHHLAPVVAIGSHGLTAQVLHEIDVALTAHELIKVRVFSDDRVAREALFAAICAELGCAPVQHLGKLLILWRETPKDAAEPKATRKHATHAARSATPPRERHAPREERRPPAAAPRRRGVETPAGAHRSPAAPAGGQRRDTNGAQASRAIRSPAAAGSSKPSPPTRRRPRGAAAVAPEPANTRRRRGRSR
jgi:putative YhbY family RNA-binding protein